ncbi:hypothetical protein BDV96DRAFT_642547 [Lophiotrema nucula]|uniref:Uncharacterized protein n=1 Tax=Lophiotrema nucula TaxID=690887 RepID=A0A6A5ZKZ4_9PLEO|nr:hypothetical protein BDV96DRAFT_642547 [Lophiotrema nucula]
MEIYRVDHHRAQLAKLNEFWTRASPGTAILVEDLCPQLVDMVGEVFRKPHPEIFAEHLHRSGHKADYAWEASSDQWVTAGFRKPFCSIRWYRPVFRHDKSYGVDTSRNIQDILIAEKQESEDRILAGNAEESASDTSRHQAPWMTVRTRKKKRQADPVQITSTTNILRNGISLVVDTAAEAGVQTPFLWEEKATVLVPDHTHNETVLILLDPLPVVQNQTGSVELPYTAHRPHRHPPPLLPELDSPKIRALSNQAGPTSTAYDLEASLRLSSNVTGNLQIADPVESLLRIVCQDVASSFELIDASLERIGALSIDDYELQTNLDKWRLQMASFQKVTNQLVQGFQQFAADFYGPGLPNGVAKLHREVGEKAARLLERIASCQSGLRADMSLLESRRGIAEAESVTRLTELAFIFIPLSFVSSLFSMQVNELSSGVPASKFVAAGCIVLIIIYGLRLAIRARSTVRLQKAVVDKARIYNKLTPSDPIPTTGFLLFCCNAIVAGILAISRFCLKPIVWGGGRMWGVWLSLAAVALIVVPTVWLWGQSGLDLSFKAVGTMIFVPACLLFAWLLLSFLYEDAGWSTAMLVERRVRAARRFYSVRAPSPVSSVPTIRDV